MTTLLLQFNLGEFEGYVINDFSRIHTADELIVNPDLDELEQLTREYSFKINEIPVGYNILLFKEENQNVLVDAGIPRPMGKLLLGLEELKIDPEDIDMIVITHSDRDHIGGILDDEGEISFPNARYVMLDEAWQHWSSERSAADLASLNNWTDGQFEFARQTYSRIKDLICAVEPGSEFIPGFQLFTAPGHRYDHNVLRVCSLDDQMMHISDALVHPLFMAKREWYSTYDANPSQAIETKMELLTMCASANALVFGAHFPFPGLGYVEYVRGCWKWKPIDEA
jgi:glyoxylase-like metal-dependent hydrolase (beta-lactamase superfamily II)